MHINLNNSGEPFLQLSPLIGRNDRGALSPLLSPDPLFLAHSQNHDFGLFQLEPDNHYEHSGEVRDRIDNESPPIPYPSNIEILDDSRISDHHLEQKSQEVRPVVRRRKEPKSARTATVKEQQLPPMKLPNCDLPPIRAIIEFLVENSSQPQRELLEKGHSLWGEADNLGRVLQCLVNKFKKLKKTKEEMTKYCMRKVFKFIADQMQKDRTHNRDVDSCMKLYFSKGQTGSNFSIPFKKNSIEKTMNGSFLKRVFSFPHFVQDYRKFLREFQALMAEDNEKKIIYLAELLEKCLKNNDVKKIQTIKRLPWSRQILVQTQELAISLLTFSQQNKEEIKDQ